MSTTSYRTFTSASYGEVSLRPGGIPVRVTGDRDPEAIEEHPSRLHERSIGGGAFTSVRKSIRRECSELGEDVGVRRIWIRDADPHLPIEGRGRP